MSYKENDVLQANYSMFCDILKADLDLLPKLVEENVISTDDSLYIPTLNPTLKGAAVLKNITGAVKGGQTRGFYALIKTMKKHGKIDTQGFASKIEKEVEAADDTSTHKGSLNVETSRPVPQMEDSMDSSSGAPAFSKQPSSQEVAVKKTATFVCSATGNNVKYLWKSESHESGFLPCKVSGKDTKTLTIPEVSLTDDDTYSCTISNDGGSVKSKAVQLTVTVPPMSFDGLQTDTNNFPWLKEDQAKLVQAKVQVLLLTANPNELNAVLQYLRPMEGETTAFRFHFVWNRNRITNNVLYIIGKYGAFNAAVQHLVKQGPHAAKDAISIANECFKECFHAVFAVGVACGRKGKNNFLDVLVSHKVSFYDSARIGTIDDNTEEYKITQRSERNCTTSEFFINHFKQNNWVNNSETVKEIKEKLKHTPKQCMGNILSGNYLVDNKKVKVILGENFDPEYIGIEMEGGGLYNDIFERRTSLQVMIVKGVCDFGDGNKNKRFQPTAALLAADCVRHYLDNDTLPATLAQNQGERTKLSISDHPSSQEVTLTNNTECLSLTCEAMGATSYYWERQDGSIPSGATGVNSRTLKFVNLTPKDAGNYRCVISNHWDKTSSDYATITIYEMSWLRKHQKWIQYIIGVLVVLVAWIYYIMMK